MTLKERIARALQRNDDKFSHLPWGCLSDKTKAAFLSDAQAALEAMISEWAITSNLAEAGAKRLTDLGWQDAIGMDANECFRAMVKAAIAER